MIDWVDGQPFSPRFGDVYFSRASGIDEARHVFLEGNRLAARFRALPPHGLFTVGETGFGTGLNFLCTWQLFVQTAPQDARLAYVSTELYPLDPADMRRASSAWPALEREAAALLAQYDWMAPGWHRFVFDGGRITLTLLIGDARRTLPDLDAVVDAWFLDGFSPARNPELWEAGLLLEISRHSARGTTFATYSSAGEVRRGLEAAGFSVEKVPGFGPKREMSRGHCSTPSPRPYCAPWLKRPPRVEGRTAIVVGGGLAGTAAAASLARRGFVVSLVERHERLAAEASGNPQGMLYIKPSPHGTVLTALGVSGLAYTLRELGCRLSSDGSAWSRCGVLLLAQEPEEDERQAKLAALGWPDAFMQRIDRVVASAQAGIDVPHGGLLFDGGWVHPPALCEALASHANVHIRPATAVLDAALRDDGNWEVADGAGPVATGAVLVVATAGDTVRFARTRHLPLKPIRGQITYLPETPGSRALRTVLCADRYVAPAFRGFHCMGATFGVGDGLADVRAADHLENLQRLGELCPALHAALGLAARDAEHLHGRAAVRFVTPDYLPLVGPVADHAAFQDRYALLARDATRRFDAAAPWLPGLLVTAAHGSRGLVSAPLSGEILAAHALGEPMPVPGSVVRALMPSRFAARSLARRHGPS
jgi:tRNA 5-methylaminomethyl-2-thiouridine biosynthesis bifunctional protein